DLSSRDARDDAIHHLNELRRREQRVMSVVHRGRAGVILEPGDRHFPLLDADDSLDDADVDLLFLERAALLDVQLEVAGDVALLSHELSELAHVAADERDALLDRLPAIRDVLELGREELAAHSATSVESALFVLPDHYFDRMPSRD